MSTYLGLRRLEASSLVGLLPVRERAIGNIQARESLAITLSLKASSQTFLLG